MALKRIALRDFVIVRELELDLAGGFSVLTGETGAGKSILIDALQLALGARAEATVVREGGLRLSPHCYNTLEEMEQVVDLLERSLAPSPSLRSG